MLGVMYDTPVPREAPPVNAAYQFIVPAEDVAPNVTVPVPHLEFGVVPVIVGVVFTIGKVAVLLPDGVKMQFGVTSVREIPVMVIV